MSKDEMQRFVITTVVVCAIVLVIAVWIVDNMEFGAKTLARLPVAITFTTFFWLFYFRWGWRRRGFKLIFNRARIDGTWVGHLQSDWKAKDSDKSGTVVPIVFVIRQTFSTVVVRSFTKDREGVSDVANLVVKEDSEIVYLSYIYALRQEFTAGSGTQHGAGELRLYDGDMHLRGAYWTTTGTGGRLRLERKTRELSPSFDSASRDWKIEEWPNFS